LDLDNISYRKLVEIGFEKLAIIVSGTYLERFKPAGTKSKKTPEEENPKILKSGHTKMLGRCGLIGEIVEAPRSNGTHKNTGGFLRDVRRCLLDHFEIRTA